MSVYLVFSAEHLAKESQGLMHQINLTFGDLMTSDLSS